jgi:hypothetical protein
MTRRDTGPDRAPHPRSWMIRVAIATPIIQDRGFSDAGERSPRPAISRQQRGVHDPTQR